ncbi:hypothetical protein V1477_016122 [Vespula maculifrons]|uniref:Uncharacterized protein n=1 Tax=Vespula maculifrons TaxID=7453 RepID=A0ABD2BC65_VESMC
MRGEKFARREKIQVQSTISRPIRKRHMRHDRLRRDLSHLFSKEIAFLVEECTFSRLCKNYYSMNCNFSTIGSVITHSSEK